MSPKLYDLKLNIELNHTVLWSSMIRLSHENIKHFLALSLLKIDTEEGKSVLYTAKKNTRKGKLTSLITLEKQNIIKPHIINQIEFSVYDSATTLKI